MAEVPGEAGREGWKTATAEGVERPEQKTERDIDTHIHTEEETAKPRIEAAITAGKHAGSSGGSSQIHRTPTQPGIGSPSPDTVSPGAPAIWGRKQTHCPPPRTLISGAEDKLPPSNKQKAQKAPAAGWKPIFKEGLDGDNTPSDATVCSRTHTYTDDDNG